MKKRLSNIWDPIRSWLGCVYLQIIKIILYGILIGLAVWALSAITSPKTTNLSFVTEGYCMDSITITYDIDVMQFPSKAYDRYYVSISYDYPYKYKDFLVKKYDKYPFLQNLPPITDSLKIKEFYNMVEEQQQFKYDKMKFAADVLNSSTLKTEDKNTLPIDKVLFIDTIDWSHIKHRKPFDFDSLTKSKNLMGISALESMSYYEYPTVLIDFVTNNSIEFKGGLIHSYFRYGGKIDGFKEKENLMGIQPCSILFDDFEGYAYKMKIADTIENKDLYVGYFNDRDYLLHYEKCFKIDRNCFFESFHEYSPDKLSLITMLSTPLNVLQTTVQEIYIPDSYYFLFYPHDLSKEFFEIDLRYEYSTYWRSSIQNFELLLDFDKCIHLASSSVSPDFVGSDQIVFSFDAHGLNEVAACTVYVDYPMLQGIQNARVTLLTVLISILFTLAVSEFVRIYQITRNRSKMNKLMAKDGFVCYGSASDCINCSGYDKCKGSKYRFSVKTQDRYCGINYRKRKKKHQ